MRLFPFLRIGTVIFALSIVTLAPQTHAGKKDDTMTLAYHVQITTVDKYFETTRIGTWIQHMGWDFS